jgi:predicted acyl esterase
MEDGQATDARIEDPHGLRIHVAIVSPGYASHLVRRFLLVLAVVLLGLVPAGRATAGDFTQTDTKVTMSDGVHLAVSYFEPKGTPPPSGWPAVILLHGIGQARNKSDFTNWIPNLLAAQYLAPEGYAVLTYDARAHGESEGLFTLDGPRELADLRELLTWLTSRPNIDAQHVGLEGASYGGGLVWKAAVADFPVAAIAPVATWTDLGEALMPQNHVRVGIVFGLSQGVPRERYGPEEAQLVNDATAERNLPAIKAYLASRSTRSQLGSIRIPTYMVQGRRDFVFDANQAIAAYRLLKGPKHLYLGDVGHSPAANPVAEFQYAALQLRAWFDRFLKGIPNGIDKSPPIQIAPEIWSTPASFKTLPKPRTLSYTFRGRRTLSADGKVARTSTPVRHVETFGSPVVKVTWRPTGYSHLVAVLSAVTPGGGETVIADGGTSAVNRGRQPQTISIRLQNEVTSIPAGSRLKVTLGARSTVQSISNLVYLLPVAEGAVANVSRITLSLPVLPKPVSK